MRNPVIAQGLAALERGEIDSQFTELVKGLFPLSERDDALDFVVVLAETEHRQEFGRLVSSADLRREVERWRSRQGDPEAYELWRIVSEALLRLETDGEVQRASRFRAFHNRNDTSWSVPEHAGRLANLDERDAIGRHLPALVQGRGGKQRILRPASARAAVLAILQVLKGEVRMNEIVAELRRHLSLCRPEQSFDTDYGLAERTPGGAIYVERTAALECEATWRSDQIWSEVQRVKRGEHRVVTGEQLLCCQILPVLLFKAKIPIDDFGPSAENAKRDVFQALKTYLPREEFSAKGDQDFDKWQIREVLRGVVANLREFCSKCGLGTALERAETDATSIYQDQ